MKIGKGNIKNGYSTDQRLRRILRHMPMERKDELPRMHGGERGHVLGKLQGREVRDE
jgi:hypothetical protein